MMKRMWQWVAVLAVATVAMGESTLFVSPKGDDGNPGALDMDLVGKFMVFLSQFPPAPRLFAFACWTWEFCLQTAPHCTGKKLF